MPPQWLVSFVLIAAMIVAGAVAAQGDPGPNVNVIGLTLDPDDIPDENYRQQNEPSCTFRPDDSSCMICAYNDYRLVDLGFDAWQGVSQSCDDGASWLSRIAPGSPIDIVAPVPAAFAADPRMKHIPGYGNAGLAILNFIGGFRDSDQGVLAIQHWLAVNKEDADFYEPARDTYLVDLGTEGRFIDKPDALPVLTAPASQGAVTLSHAMENESLGVDGVITRDYPDGLLYVAYAVFTGSNSVKVLVKVCDDWGQSCPNQAIKLSEEQNEVSGVSLTANKDGSKVLAVWRRRGDNNDTDAILYSILTRNGNNIKATKGKVLTEVCAFDQPTLGGDETPEFPMVSFRTNDFPWAASDGDNFYVFYSDVGKNPDGSCKAFPTFEQPPRPRVVLQYLDTGTTWNGPVVVDDTYDPMGIETAHPNSFQFMPAAACANGKCQVAWYDTRREAAELAALPINDDVPYVADHLDAPPDAALGFVQRKVDVYTTNFTIGDVTSSSIPPSVRVTQFPIEVLPDGSGGFEEFETEASFANKKMFGQGRFSFLGDYIEVDGRQWRKITAGPNAGKYESNFDSVPGRTEDFIVAWTDNRDVDGEIATLFETLPYNAENGDDPESLDADPDSIEMFAEDPAGPESGPPGDPSLVSEGLEGGDDSPGVCVPAPAGDDFERSRDGNIYASIVKDRVRLTAPTPGKPLGGLMRAFVVALTNEEDFDQTFTLTIENQPCDSLAVCRASFLQIPSTPDASVLPDLIEELTVPANSTLARTVFIVGASTQPVTVTAREGAAPGGPILSSVELGNSSGFLDPDVCTDGGCSVLDAELHNLTLGNLTLGNLTLGNQAILNLTLGNLTLGNLTLGNLTLDNLTLGNLTLGNLTLGNLTLGNLTLGNAALPNPTLVALGLESDELDDSSTYADLLEWAFDPANGVDPALLDPALLALTLAKDEDGDGIIDNPEDLLNLTLGNLTLGNLTLGNLTLGNLTLGNLTLGNPAEPNLTLGNLTLGNLTLGNAAIEAPVLNETACPPNPDGTPAECTVSGLAYDDYTYPLTNKGNVTTAIDADITINGDVAATQLITWKANVTATSVNCEGQLILEEQVQAVVNNPDSDLEVANIGDPFAGDATVVAGPGETVFVTFRVFGTPEQLKNVVVSGFTASSQAANCFLNELTGDFECSDALNLGIEQIFLDGPPALTIDPAGDQELEATSLDGAEFTFSATAVDGLDPNPTVTCAPFEPFVSNTYPLGETEVTCSAFDNAVPPNGVSKAFTVSVVDTSAPLIDPVTPPDGFDPESPPEPYPYELDPNSSEITVFWPVTAFDADASLTFNCTVDGMTFGPDNPPMIVGDQIQATFDYSFPVGDTAVSCTVADSNGFESTTDFTVSVLDVTPPSAPAAPTEDLSAIPAEDADGAVVSWATLYSQDAVSGQIEAVCIPVSGSLFPIGTTEVSCTAFDDAGLESAATTFNVTVVDDQAPVITINGANPDSVDQGTAYSDPGATAVDNVDGTFAATATPAVLDTSTPGTLSIEYSAADSAGNAATPQTRIVNVIDNTPPLVTAPDRVETLDYVNSMYPYFATISDLDRDVTATDGGVVLPVSCARDDGEPDDPQMFISDFQFSDTAYSITCTAIDAVGNAGSASYNLTVRYLYDIELFPPKGIARVGSTVPLDFQYKNWDTGAPVDGSAIAVRVSWTKMTDSSCTVRDSSMPEGSSGLGEDSGNSDFRYSSSQDQWQFSWQTPDVTGWQKIAVSPPGGDVENAWECIRLR